jgi:hypothetical protein
MNFLTREVFDALIYAVIIIGLILAAIRLHQDLTRPVENSNEDTQPNPAIGESDHLMPEDTRRSPEANSGK